LAELPRIGGIDVEYADDRGSGPEEIDPVEAACDHQWVEDNGGEYCAKCLAPKEVKRKAKAAKK
jgi:hypothetical protein